MAKRKAVVAIADLQKAAGGRSRQTIRAWIDAGLLPSSTIERGPGGRGRRGVWPASALDRVRFIRSKTAEGLTLGKVLEELWRQNQPQAAEVAKRVDAVLGRWGACGTSRRRAPGYEYRRGSTRGKPVRPKGASIQHEWGTAISLMLVKDVGLSPTKAVGVSILASDRPMLERALELYFLGLEPVLMLSRGCLWIASSATMGPEHCNLFHANLRPPKEVKDRPLGRITLELQTLISTCLGLSGDLRADEPIRLLFPAAVVYEIDFRHPYGIERKADVFFQKMPADIRGRHQQGGYLDAKFSGGGITVAASFTSAGFSLDSEFGPERTTKRSVTPNKPGATTSRKKGAKRTAAGRKKKPKK